MIHHHKWSNVVHNDTCHNTWFDCHIPYCCICTGVCNAQHFHFIWLHDSRFASIFGELNNNPWCRWTRHLTGMKKLYFTSQTFGHPLKQILSQIGGQSMSTLDIQMLPRLSMYKISEWEMPHRYKCPSVMSFMHVSGVSTPMMLRGSFRKISLCILYQCD